MKVMVIGGGGREHALAWKLAQSPRVDEVLVAPGNAGTASEPGMRNVDVDINNFDALIAFAQAEQVGFTMVRHRWLRAWLIVSKRLGLLVLVPVLKLPSSKVLRLSPKNFLPATIFPPAPMKRLQRWTVRSPMCAHKVRLLWLKQMA